MGLMARHDWQFHWINRGYDSFDHFLAGLKSRKRKNIRRERQRVTRAGVSFEWKAGSDLSAADLDAASEHGFPTDDKSVLGVITFLTFHETYHVGQMGLLRKFLGYDPIVPPR